MSAHSGKYRVLDFFEDHPVFTHEEFLSAHAAGGAPRSHTAQNLLAHHLQAGRILRIRRGLYATVPRGLDPTTAEIDPYLLATKLAPDAVVAYHAALQYHGKAYSVWHRYTYVTPHRARALRFRGMEFIPTQLPARAEEPGGSRLGVRDERHAGGRVRVTTLERTLVDVLDRPELSGGWEEIWRSLESIEYFELDAVIEYAELLDTALTSAQVGFYLEQHREALMVEARHLDVLRAHAPAQPRYIDRRREHGRLIAGWNLVIPERILHRTWEEPA